MLLVNCISYISTVRNERSRCSSCGITEDTIFFIIFFFFLPECGNVENGICMYEIMSGVGKCFGSPPCLLAVGHSFLAAYVMQIGETSRTG